MLGLRTPTKVPPVQVPPVPPPPPPSLRTVVTTTPAAAAPAKKTERTSAATSATTTEVTSIQSPTAASSVITRSQAAQAFAKTQQTSASTTTESTNKPITRSQTILEKNLLESPKNLSRESPTEKKTIVSNPSKTDCELKHRIELSKMDSILKALSNIPDINKCSCNSQDVKYFTEIAKIAYNSLSEEQRKIFLTLVIFKIKGDGFFHVQNDNFKDMDEFVAAVESNFLPQVSSAQALERLQCCTQSSQESISDFSERLQKLASDTLASFKASFPKKDCFIIDEHVRRESIKSFKLGLRDQTVSDGIRTTTGKSLKELSDMAVSIADFDEMRRSRLRSGSSERDLVKLLGLMKPNLSNVQEQSGLGASNSMESDGILKQLLNTQTQILESLNRDRKPSQNSVVCHYCKKPGHIQRECRARNQLKCNYCGKTGHYVDQCWARNQHGNRGSNNGYPSGQHGPSQGYAINQSQGTQRSNQGNSYISPKKQIQWDPSRNNPPIKNVRAIEYCHEVDGSLNLEGTDCPQQPEALMD